MSLNMNPDARPNVADAMVPDDLSRDLDQLTQAITTRTAAAQTATRELREIQERLEALLAQHDQGAERLAGLEEAARAAIDAITVEAEQRLSAAADRAETRVVEGLGLVEQQQHDLTRWRDDVEERMRTQLRELGEWDEHLTELRQEVGGLREMAEASLSLASGDLDKRWEATQRELREILASAESDERARWEAFMAGVSDTLASASGIDPGELETVRRDLTQLREAANETIAQVQGAQREQMAALRNEMRSLVESERSAIATAVDTKLEEARRVFLAQVQSLQDWQQQVGKDVLALRNETATARQEVSAATTKLQTETQRALAAIQSEVEQGTAHARAAAQAEVGSLRTESDQTFRAMQKQMQGMQSLALVIAIVALLLGAGALASGFLH